MNYHNDECISLNRRGLEIDVETENRGRDISGLVLAGCFGLASTLTIVLHTYRPVFSEIYHYIIGR